MRSSSMSDFGESVIESEKRSVYASSENWYMPSTRERSARTKNRREARTEQGRYCWDVDSILRDVSSAAASIVLTSSHVVFEASKVLINSTLSSKEPVAEASICRIWSSS